MSIFFPHEFIVYLVGQAMRSETRNHQLLNAYLNEEHKSHLDLILYPIRFSPPKISVVESLVRVL